MPSAPQKRRLVTPKRLSNKERAEMPSFFLSLTRTNTSKLFD
nr:MAG TPA: hypothetical protein [Caudoviricetes sp.]